jgi:hypothetical protein
MIIYRPHRGSFDDAMAEASEFANESDMFAHIVAMETANSPFDTAPFSVGDLVITGAPIHDSRNGWEDTRYVCTRRYYNEVCPSPQVVGFCATKYRK